MRVTLNKACRTERVKALLACLLYEKNLIENGTFNDKGFLAPEQKKVSILIKILFIDLFFQ